jgi:hypothetical protein
MKTNIEYIKKKIKGGYIGMNLEASKQLHLPYKHKHPEHTILVYHDVPKDVRVATIRHEEAERYAVRCLHKNRKNSHNFALKFENKNKPFPQNDIKRKLKQMGVKTR